MGGGGVGQVARAHTVIKRFGAFPAWLMLVLFLGVPLAALIPEAFAGGGAIFAQLLHDPQFAVAVRNTLLLGLISGLLSALVGAAIAIELARQSPRRRQLMLSLLGLPLAFSGLVIAYGFILAFGRAGFVTQLLGMAGADTAVVGSWIYSVGGLAFAYAYYLIPRVALQLYPVFANLDEAPTLAARTLGATPWEAWRHTVLPEVAPAVLASAFFVSSVAMGTYGTALALVGTQLNILPLMLLAKVGDGGSDFAGAAAISLVLMLICTLVLGAGDVLGSRKRRG